MNSANKGLGKMRLTEKVTRNVGILRRALAGEGSRSLVESVVEEVLPHQEWPPPPAPGKAGLLMRIDRDIADEAQAEKEYSELAKELEDAGFHIEANVVREIRDQEKMHGTKLVGIRYVVQRK